MKPSIETRIHERSYLSTGRARAAVARSALSNKHKERLLGQIEAWEGELAEMPPIVGGAAPSSALAPNGGGSPRISKHGLAAVPSLPLSVNLNARVRARLTPYGITLLYGAREQIPVFPDDVLVRQGVWETTLWQFMAVMATATMGEQPTIGCDLELLTLGA